MVDDVRLDMLDPVEDPSRDHLFAVMLEDLAGRLSIAQALALISRADLAEQLFAEDVAYEGLLDAGNVSGALDKIATALSGMGWGTLPLGIPIEVWDHLDGVEPPPTDKAYRYIKLTAGLTGSGAYNEGLLTSESVSGSGALVLATAVISAANSPIEGGTVSLINTEGRFIRAGNSGVVQMDAQQKIVGSLGSGASGIYGSLSMPKSGALNATVLGTTGAATGASANYSRIDLDSGNSPGIRVSEIENRSKNIGATFYMRIR